MGTWYLEKGIPKHLNVSLNTRDHRIREFHFKHPQSLCDHPVNSQQTWKIIIPVLNVIAYSVDKFVYGYKPG